MVQQLADSSGGHRSVGALHGIFGDELRAMSTVNVSELKHRLSHYLRLVRGGEAVIVRDRERVVARIEPAGGHAAARADDGVWPDEFERRVALVRFRPAAPAGALRNGENGCGRKSDDGAYGTGSGRGMAVAWLRREWRSWSPGSDARGADHGKSATVRLLARRGTGGDRDDRPVGRRR
jgi:antitoxin (DNA-binding transcriptional repressor) of toxin-antitoxin stability system